MKRIVKINHSFRFIMLLSAILFGGLNTIWGQTYNGTTWYSLYDHPSNQTDGYENTNKTFDVYAPTTKSCTFEWKKTGQFFGYPGCDIYISQSTNGGSSYGDENHAIASPVTVKQEKWTKKTVSVEENFNKIKFRQGGTLSRHFKNVTIPLAQHIRLVSGTYGTTSVTKDFKSVEWGTSKSYKVNFRSFLTNGNITVSIVGDDNGDFSFSSSTHGVHSLTKSDNNRSFSVGANMCASENGAANTACSTGVLGSASEYDFTVYYYPKKENVGRSYTGNTVYVNITDGKSTAKVILRGNCVKRNQTIVWDNSAAIYNTTDNITYNAVANDAISGTASGVSVTYAPTSGSPAYMSGNALQIVTSGNTTITASAAANTYYNAATNVTKKITINKVTPTVTWPEIPSGLKYNESCAVGDKVSDHWTGGSAKDDKNNTVLGTFVCDADLVPANTSYSVTFNPTKTNWYNSVSTTISGVVAKGDQTIDWPLADATTSPTIEYATGQLMGATATSGLDVAYESSNRGWGYINENGRLVVVVPNKEITISANQGGNDNWNEAPERTITFTTKGANPNQTTEVTATSITYGQTLSVSALSGNVKLNDVVIPGTLEWVDPAVMPNAGTAKHMVLFTPTNTAAYSSIYFEVPVTVAKANPVITWNITNILRENVRYSHFVESSNKEAGADLSFKTSDSELLNITDGVLTTGEVTSKQNGWIKVSQPETANYEAYNATWTLKHDVTVYPKASICLPIDLRPSNTNASEDFADANVAQVGSVNWCNTNENGRRDNYIAWFDVRYTQHQGIALGSWEAGLEGLGPTSILALITTGKFDYSPKSVDLFFSGIPNTISFDVKSQVVTSSPPDANWEATQKNWYLYVSADGENFGSPVMSWTGDRDNVSYTFTNDNIRFVRIEYRGNFTGFVKNLRITRKQYINSDKSSLLFGTDSPLNPLQEPQAITLSYSSLGVCGGSTEDAITVTSSNPAFYVDETTITENVGIEQQGTYTIRVRCNDVNQSGTLTFTSNDGTSLTVNVSSNKPDITKDATAIFQTGTEHNPVSGLAYRAQRTLFTSDILDGLFNGSTPLFDELYIYGVSESAADSREWEYSPAKGYKVPVVNASNVHTPCFVYEKDGEQYTYVRTFDAATTTLDVADTKTRVLVGYRPEGPAATALQLGTGAVVNLNNTEIVSTGVAIRVNGDTATIAARGKNTVTSASNAAVQLSGATTLGIEDNWKSGEASAVLALRPAAGYPSIDLGSASGRVYINGTQLELHNATNMAIAHMEGTTEHFDGEVHINDGTIGGEPTLGMPKYTFIDGGTFNDGTVVAYTLKGVAKRPRNSRGEIVSRHTMAPETLESLVADEYSWYGHAHLTVDNEAKVNPMLMDEDIWIFNGNNTQNADDPYSWNKGNDGLPGENDDVLINAPMVIAGDEMIVKSLTINWVRGEHGQPAVTVAPDGGLTVGDGGIDGAVENNLLLKAGQEGETKGQTGFLRIHPDAAEPMPQATVELYSTTWYNSSNEAGNTTRFQCVGTPIETDGILASEVFPTGTLLYAWNEDAEKWKNSRSKPLEPFKGYDLSQKISDDGLLVEFAGLLASGNKSIPLSYTEGKGLNLFANSYAAPIDAEAFDAADFINAEQTIYILNAGTKYESDNNQKGGLDAAGKWIGMPIETISELKGDGYPSIIPSMQGFWIQAKGENAHLKLDYSRLVYNDAVKGIYDNKPLRTPKLNNTQDQAPITGKLKIDIYGGGDADCLFILESERYDATYEDGFDARKIASETMDLFTIRDSELLGVDATNSIIGTRVGVRTGDETTYTLSFSHLMTNNELFLLDKEANEIVDIYEGVEYTFYAEPNTEITERFQILGREKAPEVTTAIEEAADNDGAKVHKFIKDNQLYILKNGVLYNATGARVY